MCLLDKGRICVSVGQRKNLCVCWTKEESVSLLDTGRICVSVGQR